MNILFVHNEYKQSGGEDTVLQSEISLLRQKKHQINFVNQQNNHIQSFLDKIKVFRRVTYSHKYRRWMNLQINYFKPDIIHIHNFFPLLTPAIYDACIGAGIPVVQTLHNYRTICPGALLMCDGKICEKCVTGSPYQAILHRCYRNSIPGSWAVARMVAYHRKRQTWQNKIDCFIALTRFAKDKFIEAGLPAEKIIVKPNFCEVPYLENKKFKKRKGALFVGRLSREKGIRTMLNAWHNLDIPLHIAGGDHLFDNYKEKSNSFIKFLGHINSEKVAKEMINAAFLVMPSEWYEGFPMVLVEAFAHGLPVIASNLGGMAEIVQDGITGLHFEPGNSKDLAEKVLWLHKHPDECQQMAENARKEYEKKYTPEKNYEILMKIYHDVINKYKKQ